jgi:hypothetical protein
LASAPVAVAKKPFAKLFTPVAVATAPFAALFWPVAVAPSPFAIAVLPKAVDLVPVAVAPDPTAVVVIPVGTTAVQFPANPVAVEKHCANAGDTPNAVIIPAAAARLRSVPPQSMLLASNRARKLDLAHSMRPAGMTIL